MAAAASGNAPAAQPALQGRWGGDRLQLVIDAQGGHVEADCASGRFPGPVAVAADGHFAALGSYGVHQPGPQPADVPAAASPAHYAGELNGDTLTLSIAPAGGAQVLVYTLHAGVRSKLVRCM